MFRKNDQHLQWPLFSSIDALPEKQQVRLQESWAGTFYDEFFCRIDEELFAAPYSDDEASRPNTPVNLLLGFETLKAGFGWSDEEAYDHFCFDIQVRYAVGHRDLSAGHFDLRTVYNFRQRVAKQQQRAPGSNLLFFFCFRLGPIASVFTLGAPPSTNLGLLILGFFQESH